MKKVLVTGGTGYIGSHTVVELIENGYEVLIIDNLSNSDVSVIDRIEEITGKRPSFAQIDICDKAQLDKVFKENSDIQAVIHFAALKAVDESIAKPIEYYSNNLIALLNILDEMHKNDVNAIVFSSSCTVYGEPSKLPVAEDAPLQPATSPYGSTKKMSEDILKDTTRAIPSLHCIALRYFNPIGAHPSAIIGERPHGVPANLIPFITQTAIGIRDELKVFGDDYNTPDGSCVRDYLHVVDLAKAHVLAVNRLLNNKCKQQYEVFNLGTGKGVSVLEAIKSFERVSGKKLKYRIVGRRPGDIEKIWADPSFSNKELGWKAQSTLDEAMKTAWEWEKKSRGIKE